ncbi:MAG: ATP-binding protein [Myxococcota bacterium]
MKALDSETLAHAICAEVLRALPVALHLYHLEDRDDDRTLRLIGSNLAAERISGSPASAMIGRTLDENFPTLRAAGLPQAYAEVARTGVPWHRDNFVHDVDNVLVYVFALQAFALPGDCVGVVFEDATARYRAQEELRRSEARQRALVHALPDTLYRVGADGALLDVKRGVKGPDWLAVRVAAHTDDPLAPGDVRVFEYREGECDVEVRLVRTSEVEQLAIVRDITERKRGDRRKDEFISIVSHELRTPLTSIRGALGLIEGGVIGEVPAAMQELVTVARTNADRLIRLINDMLDLDKMEAGRLELELDAIDALELVDSALAGVRGAADHAGVRLRRLATSAVTLVGDRDRLLQVLTNLLSNAVRFSPPQATVTVTVAAPTGYASAARVRFLVHDEGPGVPQERSEHLFHKFTQVGGDGPRRRGGTGLGLAISKAIVDQHGGTIGLVRGLGPGATFYFELPITHEPARDDLSTEDLFADLRTAYAASLPAQIETLAAWVERGRTDPAAVGEAVSLAHRLKGTAGTYGLPAVSAASAILEGALQRAARADIDAAVRTLRELARG